MILSLRLKNAIKLFFENGINAEGIVHRYLQDRLEKRGDFGVMGFVITLPIYGLLDYCKQQFNFNVTHRDQDCSHIFGLLKEVFIPQDS